MTIVIKVTRTELIELMTRYNLAPIFTIQDQYDNYFAVLEKWALQSTPYYNTSHMVTLDDDMSAAEACYLAVTFANAPFRIVPH